jgi:hypothetical protein
MTMSALCIFGKCKSWFNRLYRFMKNLCFCKKHIEGIDLQQVKPPRINYFKAEQFIITHDH